MEPSSSMSKLVYVAGPLFSDAERSYLELMVRHLSDTAKLDPDTDFFLPHRDGGELGKGFTRKDIFELDISQVRSAKIVVALLDGQDVDSGTCIELGYAFAEGKKIFGLLTDLRAHETAAEPRALNLMVWGVCEEGRTLHSSLPSLAAAFAGYVRSVK